MMRPSSLVGKRILVTGASSFIGLRLCELLAKYGAEVYAMVREGSPGIQQLLHLQDVRCVIGSTETIEKTFQELILIDIVYHLAWSGVGITGRSDSCIQAHNYSQSMNVLFQSRLYGCKLFLFGGSQAEYGNNHSQLTSELSDCHPESEYGKAKLKFTTRGIEFCRESGMNYRMGRIFSVYGPGDHPWTLVSSLIASMYNNQVLPLSSCSQYWNFLYIDDAANALIALSSAECPNGIYNIASQTTQPLKNFVDVIKGFFPDSPPPGFDMVDQSSDHSLNPCISKLLHYTTWRESFSFEQGIRQALDKFKQAQGMLSG